MAAEQLVGQLTHPAARHAMADREQRDRGLQARAENARGDIRRQQGPGSLPALRAADGVRAMLGHDHRGRRQLEHLMATRLASANTLAVNELLATPRASRRPMINHRADLAHQLARAALMPPLATLRTTAPR